jgi:hypothetical protein
MSAISNRRAEDVIIEAVVILELAFRNVEREIFAAHLVVAADDRPLELRPEAFNRVRVDGADNVTLGGVVDGFVIVVQQAAIDATFIGRQQTDLIRNDLANERLRILLGNRVQNAGHHVALAANGTDDRGFGGGGMFPAAASLVPMLILVLAADVGLIDLDNAAEFLFRLDQSGPDFMAHAPSGFVRAEAHEPHDLKGAHSLFAGEHQVSDLEPVSKWLVRVLKDGPGNSGEAIAVLGADFALPMEAGSQRINLDITTAGAMDAFGPASGDQIRPAGRFINEKCLKLGTGHLVDRLGAAGHGVSSFVGGYHHVSRFL